MKLLKYLRHFIFKHYDWFHSMKNWCTWFLHTNAYSQIAVKAIGVYRLGKMFFKKVKRVLMTFLLPLRFWSIQITKPVIVGRISINWDI